jgi:hypothetical protein
MTQRCSKCAAENPEGQKFCGSCGAKFVPIAAPVAVAGEDGVFYCHKHKKETTRVSCGRCERPICTRCVVVGPAGVRCQACAKNKVPMRLRGVLHDTGRAARNVNVRQVWYIAMWVILIDFFRGMFGGHDV